MTVAQDTSLFRNLSIADGLHNNSVKALLKDSVGFIWIGARTELYRFDGHEVRSYNSTFEDEILALEELDAVTLIVGTATSLFEFDRVNDRISRIELDAVSSRVKAIRRIDANSYLVGTQQSGLYLIDKNKQAEKIILDANISASNHITAIERENEDVFWISTANGLGKYTLPEGKAIHYKLKEGPDSSNYFYSLCLIDSTIYLGSFNKGVFRFDIKSGKFDKIPDFGNDYIYSMDYNGDGKLYVGTDGKGIKVFSLYEDKIVDVITKQRSHSISSNALLTLRIYDSVLWVTSMAGVDYTPSTGKLFSAYRTKNLNTVDYNIRSIFITPNGDKLIGTRSGLFYVSDRRDIVKEYTMEDPRNVLRSNIILCIDEFDGNILVGTYGGGLYLFDEETLTLKDFSPQEPFQNGCFFRFQPDREGNIWFATSEGFFSARMDGTLLRKYNMTNTGLVDHVILFLFRDSMDRLFLATHFGVWLMEPGTEIIRSDIFEPKYNRALNLVHYIFEDSRKNIWFCSNQGVLKVDFDLKPQKYFSDADHIPGNVVKSVIEDDSGNIWIATSTQIIKYETESELFYPYQYVDGLTGYEFNNSVWKSSDGSLWWANEGGLLYHNFETDKVVVQKDRMHPVIIGYYAAGVENNFVSTSPNTKVILNSSQKDILIKFSYLDYSHPHAEVFEFRLKGYDKEWQRQIGSNSVRYSSLPPGEYLFELRSPDDHDNMKTLPIVVRRSYYTIIWIIVTCLIVISLLLYFFNTIKRMANKIRGERLVLASMQKQTQTTAKVNMSEEKVEEVLNNLLACMQDEKPYLSPKLKISDLSAKLGCTTTELSQILNVRLGVNFADFVNVYRVNQVKHLLNSENLSKYTLKALSEKSGFNSKSTFYRVFKKVTGNSPLEYCSKMNITIVEE